MRRAIWLVSAVMALAVGMFLFGYPTRTYLDQRSSLAQEQTTVDRLAADNQALRTQAAQLQTPAEIQRIARQEYGLVEPGQEEYAILPNPIPAKPSGAAGKTGARTARDASSTGHRTASTASTASTATPAAAGGVWSRFVHQFEFWG